MKIFTKIAIFLTFIGYASITQSNAISKPLPEHSPANTNSPEEVYKGPNEKSIQLFNELIRKINMIPLANNASKTKTLLNYALKAQDRAYAACQEDPGCALLCKNDPRFF